MPLNDISFWARTSGLEIVYLVTGAALLARFGSWFGKRLATRAESSDHADPLVRSERAKHRTAVIQAVTWAVLGILYLVTAIMVLRRLGLPLTSMVAPASVVGVALGFGAQRVVQDLLAGFFIVIEHQYGFGDVVRVSQPGTPDGVTGTVEEVTLRVTQLRTVNGELLIIPNGQILQVTNLSRDWARAVIDVPVAAGADLNEVTDRLRAVGEAAYDDEDLRPLILDPPSVMGVESMAVDQYTVRVVARTLPGRQFDVSRALRARVASEFRDAGIVMPAPASTVAVG